MSGPNFTVHVLCTSSHLLLCAQKCDHLPPPQTYTFLKGPFLTDFKKYTHTPPPQGNDILAHWTESSENLGKVPKPTELAHYELPPRDILGGAGMAQCTTRACAVRVLSLFITICQFAKQVYVLAALLSTVARKKNRFNGVPCCCTGTLCRCLK